MTIKKKTMLMLATAVMFCMSSVLAIVQGTPIAISAGATQFDSCDSLKDADSPFGWEGGILDTDCKEGTGAFRTYSTGLNVLIPSNKRKAPLVTDGLTKENAQLSFWLKINEVTHIKDEGGVEISSSGTSDVEEYSWSFQEIKKQLTNGWNFVKLHFKDAAIAGGTPNVNALNYIRLIVVPIAGEVDLSLDDVQVKVTTIDPPGPEPEETTYQVLQTCETAWEGTELSDDRQVGNKSVRCYSTNKNVLIPSKAFTAVKTGGLTEENAQLSLWLKVNEVNNIKDDSCFEITSSGTSDDQEFSWSFSTFKSKLNNGWNFVELDFSAANKSGAEPKINALNYIRVIMIPINGELDVQFDQIIIKNRTLMPESAIINTLNNCDTLDYGYDVTLDTTDKKEGSGSIVASSGDNGRLIIAGFTLSKPMMLLNIGKESGALGLWLYVNDAQNLQGSTFVLGSGSDRDNQAYKWDGSSISVQNGWNYVVFEFAKASQKWDNFDPNHIQLFQWLLNASPNTIVKFDEMMLFNKHQFLPENIKQYTVKFNANGGTGSIDDFIGFTNQSIQINCSLTKTDYVFLGWSLTATGETLGQVGLTKELTDTAVNGIITLYAKWTKPTKAVQVHSCDYNWKNSLLDKNDKKKGSASVMATNSNHVDFSCQYRMNASGLTEDNAVVSFWLYINDISALPTDKKNEQSGWLELGSVRSMDADSFKWYISSFSASLVNGWNKVNLNVSDANVSGNADINHLQSARVLVVSNGSDLTIKIDDLLLLNKELTTVDEVQYITVKYDGNHATAGSLTDMTVVADSEVFLAMVDCTRFGYVHRGWSLSRDKEPLTSLVATQDNATNGTLTLYAVWQSLDELVPEDADNTYKIAKDMPKGCGSSTKDMAIVLFLLLTSCVFIFKR